MTTSGGRLCGTMAVCALFATVLLMSTGASANAIVKTRVQLLGMHECTYGPSFWCQNITNAAGCKAVKHCIQTTWETQKYPEDNDDVCTICKNMVKEARDTLTSNATLDEIQQVFYGSCQLLPLKVIKTECKKLADDFIPELVDTLASEMDPNVVCTVAGLCNNDRIDRLLSETPNNENQKHVVHKLHDCEKCAIVMDKGENLVQSMTKDEVLNKILMMCGELSSYSDACSTVVLTYNNEIYTAIANGFTKRNICMLSGMCSEAFHPHTNGYNMAKNALKGVEISNAGERGRIQIEKSNHVSDDLTCEFCETLVKHLKDILVANTTEEQFLDVLKGLCKQTGSFSNECSAVIEENYTRIYQFLTSELKGKVLCTIVGICPKSQNSNIHYMAPMYPLLPINLIQPQETKQIKEDSLFSAMNEQSKQKPTLIIVDEQPPKIQDIKLIKKSPVIDVFYKETHFVVNNVDMPTEKTVCFLCQSILNYVQQAVTDPKSEEEIRDALEKSCVVIPSSFKQQCIQFIDQYADAFISLLAQEVDPSTICPELNLCPAIDMSLTSTKDNEGSNNNCQMCVIFMSVLESEISNKDTEEVIQKKLKKLCSKMPLKWKQECTDFVSNELESILDMVIAQIKPEEMCVLLSVCQPKTIDESIGGDIETNMIASSGKVSVVFPGYDMGKMIANNYKMLEEPKVPTPLCLVCTVVMKYLHGMIKDRSNQAEIQQVLDTVCSVLPNIEEKECQDFIDSNYQNIVKCLEIGTDPGVACMALMVCEEQTKTIDLGYGIKLRIGERNHDSRKINLSKKNELSTQAQPTELDTSDECMACEAFVKVFDDRLNNDSVKIDELDLIELCNEIDIQHKDQANDLLNLLDYGCKAKTTNPNNDWLIRGLIQTVWSDCAGRCLNAFHPKCMICKDVIRDIKDKMKISPVEQEIKFRLESLCDPLPNKDKCVEFVERNTEKFLNTIIDDINETSVCQEIGYC